MVKSKKKRQGEKGALEIIEEAVSLLRGSGAGALAYYYLGSLPFMLALLYYWADMSKSAVAYSRVEGEALVLALLFIWMKMWQAVYGRELLMSVLGEAGPGWSFSRLVRVAVKQGITQASGLFVLPIALLLVLPFGRAYALYQNMIVLDDGKDLDARGLMRKSAELGKLWQKQNYLLIWALSPYLLVTAAVFFLAIAPIMNALASEGTSVLIFMYGFLILLLLMPLSPFGVAIAVNIASLILFLPRVLKAFFGVETAFTITPGGMINGTFFAVVCGLTYLCLDPLMKAAYVLRCYYGESLRTGADLRAELRRCAGKAVATLLMILFLAGMIAPGIARAAERDGRQAETVQSSVSPPELDKALDQELQRREYAWRLPREKPAESGPGIISSIMQYIAETLRNWFAPIARWLRKIYDWIRNLWPKFEPKDSSPRNLWTISGPIMLTLYILLAALLSVSGVLLWRILKRRAAKGPILISQPVAATPNIEDENTIADQLPEEGWLKMARELSEKGQYRLAMRAVFLGTLAFLGHCEFIYIARFKSNLDYMRELMRRAHANPGVLDTFSNSVSIYEAIWYGMHEATKELLDNVIANQEKLRACAQRQ